MEYLFFLQNLRESSPGFINEGILFLSEFMGGTGALAVMALVYWCISKYAGSLMLLNFSSAYMMNQTLKNIFPPGLPSASLCYCNWIFFPQWTHHAWYCRLYQCCHLAEKA